MKFDKPSGYQFKQEIMFLYNRLASTCINFTYSMSMKLMN